MNKNKKKVLVVDDEQGVRQSFRMTLKDNYDILEANNGKEALKILQENRPDVILLDIIMPQMSGIEVLKNMKEIGVQVPIIVITAIKDTDAGKEAMKLGAFDYLTKPLDVKKLEALIQKTLGSRAVILVVDDELGVRDSCRLVLKDEYNVLTATNGQECLKIVEDQSPSAVLLDIRMPDIDGIEVLKQIREMKPHLPVVILTGVGTHRTAIEAIKLGAADFIVKPVSASHLKKAIEDVLTKTKKELLVKDTSVSVEDTLKKHYLDTLKSLSKVIESRDPYTKRHSEQVAKYAIEIAKELGSSDEEIEIMEQAALLHDIGKIGVKDSILHKPDKLNSEEWKEVKKHPEIGEEILQPFKLLHIEQAMIRYHHERFDGTGYPDGLKGEETPIYARILAVADSYDAMVSLRPYRRAFTSQEVKEELEKCKSNQFDPRIVDAFLRVLEKKGKKDKRSKEANSLNR